MSPPFRHPPSDDDENSSADHRRHRRPQRSPLADARRCCRQLAIFNAPRRRQRLSGDDARRPPSLDRTYLARQRQQHDALRLADRRPASRHSSLPDRRRIAAAQLAAAAAADAAAA